MIIQLNTDSNTEGNSELTQQLKTIVENSLKRFSEQITRLEVHLSDGNSDKKFGAEDKHCLLEARLAGLQPIAVSHQAATVHDAVDGAVGKMMRSIDRSLGQLGKR